MAKGQDVYTVNLNNVDHDFKDRDAHSDISIVNAQIETLSQQIQTMSLNLQTLQTSLNQAKQQLQDLQAIVPQEASSENILADKDYVDTQVEQIIDDTTASSNKVYSSQKTQNELDGRVKSESATRQEIKNTSATDTPFYVHSSSTDNECWIGFKNRDNFLGYFGSNTNHVPLFNNGSTTYELATTSSKSYFQWSTAGTTLFNVSAGSTVSTERLVERLRVHMGSSSQTGCFKFGYEWARNVLITLGGKTFDSNGGTVITWQGQATSGSWEALYLTVKTGAQNSGTIGGGAIFNGMLCYNGSSTLYTYGKWI